jgi:hypothetical protein
MELSLQLLMFVPTTIGNPKSSPIKYTAFLGAPGAGLTACGCCLGGVGAFAFAMFPNEQPEIVYLPLGKNVLLDKPETPRIRNDESCPHMMAVWIPVEIGGPALACAAGELPELGGVETAPAGKRAIAVSGEPAWKLMVWAEPGFAFEVVWMELGTAAGAAAAPLASIPGCGAPESIPV